MSDRLSRMSSPASRLRRARNSRRGEKPQFAALPGFDSEFGLAAPFELALGKDDVVECPSFPAASLLKLSLQREHTSFGIHGIDIVGIQLQCLVRQVWSL
jgi:hypothetical protein